jgi:voltage-gated potassium channel
MKNKMDSSLNNYILNNLESRKNLWRNNVILFLALIILIFLLPVAHLPGNIALRITLGVVVISGVFAAEFSKKVSRILLLLALVVILLLAAGILFKGAGPLQAAGFILVIISLVLSTVALVTHVGGSDHVDRSTILCAINSYLMIGLTASVLFMLLELLQSNSFSHLEYGSEELNSLIYFGFVTLTTLGYGDITPIAPLARSLSTFVALTGQLYLVIIMALIIGKYLQNKER